MVVCVLFSMLCFACEREVYMPKPRGYFRIDIQDTTYQELKGTYPYAFEYSHKAFVDPLENREQYWINLIYPELDAVLFITYKDVGNTTLDDLINDARTMALKQIVKADDIIESYILDSASNLYGRIYETVGNDAACPFQFWVTDREDHFLRGSLYLNHVPQNDSLAPVINYLKKDMLHLIRTFKWNEVDIIIEYPPTASLHICG
ncbi:MAG: gliding motility lipoprotein GldD [Bacteroidales bacterium]|jgi:gliding motility-associated lipoprotein GldD|nr:gliding motility lipoprotein GldD [Bacteroidales bacterium]